MMSKEDVFERHTAVIRLNDGELEHHAEVELAADGATDDSTLAWKAYWFVPDEPRALSIIHELLTDDINCTLVLSDGREGAFTFSYDGVALHLLGLTPLRPSEWVSR